MSVPNVPLISVWSVPLPLLVPLVRLVTVCPKMDLLVPPVLKVVLLVLPTVKDPVPLA